MTGDINTTAFLGDLKTLASRFHLPLESIEAVTSIMDWCHKQNIPEDNPFRAGKLIRDTQTGQYKILLASRITQDMVCSVTGDMVVHGFRSKIELLSDATAFLYHLVLHEIARGLDGKRSEADCDLWAFEQLGSVLPSNSAFERDAVKRRPST